MIGSHCLKLLLSDDRFDEVVAVLRRPLDIEHPKLRQVIIDFDKMNNYAAEIRADAVLSTLGTTLRKAGSSVRFTKVDYEYQLQAAEIARRNGARIFILLSSLGADKKSRVLYTKVKGEIEDAISKLGYDKVIILRPSILLGDRAESRPGEAVGQWVARHMPFLFSGPMARYRGIPAETVAHAMINAVQKPYNGVGIVENLEIFEWAKN